MSGGRHLPGGKSTQMREKEWAIVKSDKSVGVLPD